MPSLLISYGVRIVYHIVLATTKAAVLTLYLRVFRNQKSKYIIWGTLTFVTLYTISLIFVSIFQCRPIRGAWDLTTKAACINFNLIMYLSAAVNVLVDIALVAIAIPNIRESDFKPF